MAPGIQADPLGQSQHQVAPEDIGDGIGVVGDQIAGFGDEHNPLAGGLQTERSPRRIGRLDRGDDLTGGGLEFGLVAPQRRILTKLRRQPFVERLPIFVLLIGRHEASDERAGLLGVRLAAEDRIGDTIGGRLVLPLRVAEIQVLVFRSLSRIRVTH